MVQRTVYVLPVVEIYCTCDISVFLSSVSLATSEWNFTKLSPLGDWSPRKSPLPTPPRKASIRWKLCVLNTLALGSKDGAAGRALLLDSSWHSTNNAVASARFADQQCTEQHVCFISVQNPNLPDHPQNFRTSSVGGKRKEEKKMKCAPRTSSNYKQ